MRSSSSDSRCGTTTRMTTGRSTSSATSTAATMNWRSCWRSLGTHGKTAAGAYRHPAAGRPSSSAIWSTAGRGFRRRLPLVMSMVDAGDALCVPGNHDVKLLRTLWGQGRPDHARTGDSLTQLAEASRQDLARAFADCSGVHRRPGQPLRSRRRQAGRRARRHEGRDAGTRLGQGAGVRAVRRDDRRDRRVRPAGALQLGGGVSRQGDGGLRPHAGAGTGVAESHDQHRHRLRLRRQADGAALPGAGVRVGAGASGPMRTGPPVCSGSSSRRLHLRPSRCTTMCWTSRMCSASGSSRRGCIAT